LVVCATPARRTEAIRLARRLGVAFTTQPPGEPGQLMLVYTDERLQLQVTGRDAPGAIFAEFVAGRTGHRGRQGEQGGEALAHAAGARHGHTPTVIDATAGLGRDAFVLAARGCRVTLIERDPVVAALLADGLSRARAAPEIAPIVERMAQVEADACTYMAENRSGVVLVDPMHPPRKKSAAVKKEMRVLRDWVGPDRDSDALLAAAREAARERVVVKRPKGAVPLAGLAPSGEVTGRSTRFDIYKGLASGSD
jgi:16S rRNA (guanine1516-N2)-methyltransferase